MKKDNFMKYINFLFTLVLCATIHINSKGLGSSNKPIANMSTDEQIQYQVNMTLEWAKTEKEMNGEESLKKKKDTVQFLNPRPGDNEIQLEAKKRAKEQLFPSKPSYWKRYAPQFMQNTVNYLRNLYR